MTRWFLDTEFNEDGKTIELISIALVSESGVEYYAGSNEYRPGLCNDWVKQNVLPKLPHEADSFWRSRSAIADDIRSLVFSLDDLALEFWAYFADYDWVVLCQLYGRMVDLPEGFPMYCLDLKQEMHRRGIPKSALPKQRGDAHSALDDARWVRDTYLWMQGLP
jgi:hypothetical protein